MTERGALGGQVALVTGGSRGAGKGIAQALAAAGTSIYVTGRTVAKTEFATASCAFVVDGLRRGVGRTDLITGGVPS